LAKCVPQFVSKNHRQFIFRFHSIEQTSIEHDVSAGQCHRIDHRIFLDMELIIECL
jgi:hypothetical protein